VDGEGNSYPEVVDMNHIFFSYSRKHADCAFRLVRGLQSTGFSVWQDVSVIRGGDNWVSKIRSGLKEARVMLLLWSAEAKASEWVTREIALALPYHTEGKLIIIPLRLDDTPLPDDLQSINAITIPNCAPSGLGEIVAALAPVEGLRWRLTTFSADRPLGEQEAAPIMANPPLVSKLLIESQECRASIVGRAEAALADRKVVQVCLRFTGDRTQPFLSEIYNTVTQDQSDGFFGLYIEGRYDPVVERYRLDDDNNAQWLESIYVAYKAINETIGGRAGITLQLFCAAPNALTFGLGQKLYRFYRTQIYNYIPRQTAAPHYKLVLDSAALLD